MVGTTIEEDTMIGRRRMHYRNEVPNELKRCDLASQYEIVGVRGTPD
jgi:hypothetical protein